MLFSQGACIKTHAGCWEPLLEPLETNLSMPDSLNPWVLKFLMLSKGQWEEHSCEVRFKSHL